MNYLIIFKVKQFHLLFCLPIWGSWLISCYLGMLIRCFIRYAPHLLYCSYRSCCSSCRRARTTRLLSLTLSSNLCTISSCVVGSCRVPFCNGFLITFYTRFACFSSRNISPLFICSYLLYFYRIFFPFCPPIVTFFYFSHRTRQ